MSVLSLSPRIPLLHPARIAALMVAVPSAIILAGIAATLTQNAVQWWTGTPPFDSQGAEIVLAMFAQSLVLAFFAVAYALFTILYLAVPLLLLALSRLEYYVTYALAGAVSGWLVTRQITRSEGDPWGLEYVPFYYLLFAMVIYWGVTRAICNRTAGTTASPGAQATSAGEV